MAEEINEQEDQQSSGSSSLVRTIILLAVAVLLPAIVGLSVWNFVLRPMMAPAEAAQDDEPEVISLAGTVIFTFEETQASVVADTIDGAAPLLVYQLLLLLDSQKTYSIVEAHQDWFAARLGELHRNRTRTELNDPLVQEAIRKQARQEANRLLRQLAPGTKGEVLEVKHKKYAIFDL